GPIEAVRIHRALERASMAAAAIVDDAVAGGLDAALATFALDIRRHAERPVAAFVPIVVGTDTRWTARIAVRIGQRARPPILINPASRADVAAVLPLDHRRRTGG